MVDLNKVLENIDIVDVVSEYVDLQRKGKNYFGVCPFHDDSNPSMSVSTQKQLYKCFSCGAGGNAVTFVQNIENISFKEALNKLAKSIGMDVEYTGSPKVVDNYFDIYLDATKYFMYSLFHTKEGLPYFEYLQKRGFNYEVLNDFQIGVSSNKIIDPILEKYDKKDVNKTGIINSSNNLIFKDRIVFPITDINDNVVGYSGRVINDAHPKYLNTGETKYFKKSHILYNYAKAKSAIAKEQSVIITEGFFDVMRLATIEVNNVVATMGTAFTNYHAKMINDITNTVYLNMDGDKAGVDASLVIFEMLKNYNIKMYMVDIGEYDPDEYILKYGGDKYIDKLKYAKVYEEFFIDYLIEGFLDLSVGDKEVVIEQLTKFVNNMNNDVTQQLLVNYIQEKIGITIKSIAVSKPATTTNSNNNTQYHKKIDSIVESYYNAVVIDSGVINRVELEFLSLLLNNRRALDEYVNTVKMLNIKKNDEVAMLIKEYYIQNVYQDLKSYIDSRSADYNEEQLSVLQDTVKEITELNINGDDHFISDYVVKIITYKYDKRVYELNKQVSETSDVGEQQKLLQKISVLKNECNLILEKGRL